MDSRVAGEVFSLLIMDILHINPPVLMKKSEVSSANLYIIY